MKKIGILLRDDEPNYILKKKIINVIKEYKAIPIGIVPSKLENIKELIDFCDAFILQGGTWYLESDIEIVKYLYEKDVPVLGICLGMQIMGICLGGKLKEIGNNNHQSEKDYVHEIVLKKDGKLFNILNKEKLLVNSRHIHNLVNLNSKYITGYSPDNIIEVVEDASKKFFIGVQWHPEIIYKDQNSIKLFDYFFLIVNKKDTNN